LFLVPNGVFIWSPFFDGLTIAKKKKAEARREPQPRELKGGAFVHAGFRFTLKMSGTRKKHFKFGTRKIWGLKPTPILAFLNIFSFVIIF
jgi:hypothetical protein